MCRIKLINLWMFLLLLLISQLCTSYFVAKCHVQLCICRRPITVQQLRKVGQQKIKCIRICQRKVGQQKSWRTHSTRQTNVGKLCSSTRMSSAYATPAPVVTSHKYIVQTCCFVLVKYVMNAGKWIVLPDALVACHRPASKNTTDSSTHHCTMHNLVLQCSECRWQT